MSHDDTPPAALASPYAAAVSLYQGQHFAQALATLELLLQAQPAQADALNLAAICLRALHREQEAEACLRRILAQDPGHADALCNLGNLLTAMKRWPQAEAAYRQALQARPDHAETHHNHGMMLRECKRLPEAEAAFRQALALQPGHVDACNHLGLVLLDLDRPAEAEAAYRQALALHPGHAHAWNNLGMLLYRQKRLPQAEAAYLQALALRPDLAETWNNLGLLRYRLGQLPQAMDAFRQAAAVQPDHVDAHYNLGVLLEESGALQEAEAAYRRVLELRPGHGRALNNLGTALTNLGLLDEGLSILRRAVQAQPEHASCHSNLAYKISFQAEDGHAMREESLRWAARHEAPLRATWPAHANSRDPERRLRIGYVSPDFRTHCQSLFTLPVFSQHDHTPFEFFFYSSVQKPDHLTRRLMDCADVWRDVHALGDEQLAQQIREDGIDILVDLTMHMAKGRPLLFARKPAPVQIAWLAYPGTTGLAAMDYRLTDPWLDPPGTEGQYTERSIRLPDAFWCYDPQTPGLEVNALPALTQGHVSFGSLNNPGKLNARTFRLWAAVLARLPQARLRLLLRTLPPDPRLLRLIETQGIALERIDFIPFQARIDYLRVYHGIDIALDTFPYNGHTTSLDAFWMGVPVVSRIGDTAAGRGGLSQLMNLGLGELAARTDEEFIDTAVQLASDLPRLAALRQGLRSRLERSPLMDGARFARHLETVYRQVWQDWCGE